MRAVALPNICVQRYNTEIPLVKFFTDYFYFAVTPITHS
ncbi:hypothetical protein HMPREF9137_1817 [Prevotella denticola F0289]|nr:hypothetical protein HMPREF9137_1817 [Prevotella denticola F0289]